jgi:excisionase family DNA binding protein
MKDSPSLTSLNNVRRNEPTALLTTQGACDYLQCTRRYLERMVRSGRLRALKPSSKFVRYRQIDIEAFLESGATMECG